MNDTEVNHIIHLSFNNILYPKIEARLRLCWEVEESTTPDVHISGHCGIHKTITWNVNKYVKLIHSTRVMSAIDTSYFSHIFRSAYIKHYPRCSSQSF